MLQLVQPINIKTTVFWYVTPCSMEHIDWHLRARITTLMMKAVKNPLNHQSISKRLHNTTHLNTATSILISMTTSTFINIYQGLLQCNTKVICYIKGKSKVHSPFSIKIWTCIFITSLSFKFIKINPVHIYLDMV
jgi:hypothetical protein